MNHKLKMEVVKRQREEEVKSISIQEELEMLRGPIVQRYIALEVFELYSVYDKRSLELILENADYFVTVDGVNVPLTLATLYQPIKEFRSEALLRKNNEAICEFLKQHAASE